MPIIVIRGFGESVAERKTASLVILGLCKDLSMRNTTGLGVDALKFVKL